MTKPGTLVAAFEDDDFEDWETPIVIEIRLVLADDGTEMLWHYENGVFVQLDRAIRCHNCDEVIAARGVRGTCFRCIDTEEDL